ncbi:4-hydroxybenzoate polyprenyltransferase [Formicincola oecophyllae]|uniref:4-hydroxybenzoate octaprenyltransferase n=1 Tax=Formicincola oecophyllae TaxID=2558361 RepID=A0A4Y6U6Y0_9PROT|nr:4-hydroxybenzoate octaprenyltransferase [Formicincola oecophyllae]QDH12914.1 4-hydroxybenzoate polyprenyltransferase [Formicincola oecophyllae]
MPTSTHPPHTDIRSDGWLAHCPAQLQPWLLLMRLDRPVGTWLLFLPGVWGVFLPQHVSFPHRLKLVALFAAGSVLMRSAGCVINDLWDRDIDAQVERTKGRPLASGALSVRQGMLCLALLLLGGLGVLVCLPAACWELAPLALLLVALYPLAKRVTWWPQLVMGFTFGFGAPMGVAAASGRFWPGWAGLALYGATIAWQLGFDTIYGFQDLEDDARVGVKSTSRLWVGQARAFVGSCYAVAVALWAVAALIGQVGWAFWPFWLLGALMLAGQVRGLQPANPQRCLHDFQANITLGMVLALGFVAGRLL